MEIQSISFDKLKQYLVFLFRCNSQTQECNDLIITKVVYEHIGDEEFPSIDEIAKQANVSKAAISRFCRKYGFKNYISFRNAMGAGAITYGLNHKLLNISKIMKSDEEIVEDAYLNIVHNITNTKEHLNIQQLKQITDYMKTAKDITFIGGKRAIGAFHMLQMELLSSGKPAYLFDQKDTSDWNAEFFTSDSLVIFVSASKEFFNDTIAFNRAKEAHSTIICIHPTDFEYQKDCDLYIQYTIEGDVNSGIHSLMMISNILENLYYKS